MDASFNFIASNRQFKSTATIFIFLSSNGKSVFSKFNFEKTDERHFPHFPHFSDIYGKVYVPIEIQHLHNSTFYLNKRFFMEISVFII